MSARGLRRFMIDFFAVQSSQPTTAMPSSRRPVDDCNAGVKRILRSRETTSSLPCLEQGRLWASRVGRMSMLWGSISKHANPSEGRVQPQMVAVVNAQCPDERCMVTVSPVTTAWAWAIAGRGFAPRTKSRLGIEFGDITQSTDGLGPFFSVFPLPKFWCNQAVSLPGRSHQ